MEPNLCTGDGLKEKLNYFSLECIEDFFEIPANQPDIEHIVSSVTDCEILSLKIINTLKGLSYEGQNLTGKKLAAEIKLKQKLLYVSDRQTKSVHIIENESFHCSYTVIPCRIEGTEPDLLINNKILQCKAEVNDTQAKVSEKRKVYRSYSLFISVILTPTYELSFTLNTSKDSHVFIMHNDGTRIYQLTSSNDNPYGKPLWSPRDGEIAYLSECGGVKNICIYSLNLKTGRALTLSSNFTSIGSYSWSQDASRLAFSGKQSVSKEIYTVDINGGNIKQLTDGNGIFESLKPKYSPCDDKLAFIRISSGFSDLWLMNGEGLDFTRLTSCGYIRYFDWSPDGKKIIFVYDLHDKKDQIGIMELEENKKEEICLDLAISAISKIKYSPDGNGFAFIGSLNNHEDIYTYDFSSKALNNITDNHLEFSIIDYVWNADADRIYFSASDLYLCSIFSLCPDQKLKTKLFSKPDARIELSYRGRIY